MKLKIFTVLTFINVFAFLFIYPKNIYAQGFGSTSSFFDITSTSNSGEKPQSKVWKYLDKWYAIIPVAVSGVYAQGTWLWRLDGQTWSRLIILSTSTSTKADAVVDGIFTHILLYDGQSNSKFITIKYVSETYEIMDPGPGLVSLTLGSNVETATIAINSNDRMWLAYEASNDINVQWSISPYSSWNGPIVLESGVDGDDIAAVTAFDDNGNKIGVMWSNQNSKEFRFAYLNDGDDASILTNWNFETAATTPPDPPPPDPPIPSGGIADDHVNFAVASDGTIYAAVKTGYDDDAYPTVALLVRRPNGSWDNIYSVKKQVGSHQPTRPIALLDETNGIITVVYTQDVGGENIMYKSSSTTSPINFFPDVDGFTLISGTNWDDASSTKQNFHPDVVILASSSGNLWRGVIGSNISPTPVELAFFAGTLNGNNVELRWRTETEVNNYGFYIERATENTDWLALGFVEGNGNSNSPKYYTFIDSDIYESDNYYYRLKQTDNDGTFEYSDVVTVIVGVPVLFVLSQNYPNPFNPETRIDYTLPEQQNVSMRVYNMLGEIVQELVNEVKPAGTYTVTFDGSNLPSGIYVYRIQTEGFSENKKMTLLK